MIQLAILIQLAIFLFLTIIVASQLAALINLSKNGVADVKSLSKKALFLSTEIVSTFGLICLTIFTNHFFILIFIPIFVFLNLSILISGHYENINFKNRYEFLYKFSAFRFLFGLVCLAVLVISSWLAGKGYQFVSNFISIFMYILFALFYPLSSIVGLFAVESIKRWLLLEVNPVLKQNLSEIEPI